MPSLKYILERLIDSITTVHLDMSGNHRYALSHKSHAIISEAKAMLANPTKKLKNLTGKQLRHAAENKIPVWLEMIHHELGRPDFSEEVIMTPAKYGYYIGPTDIDPNDYEDDELVVGHDIDEGTLNVYGLEGVGYEPK